MPQDNDASSSSRPEHTEKENQPQLQRLKLPNRRDSLGRGILKNYNPQDDNNTVAVMQIPLRDSQQDAARPLIEKKSYRRRVSFAPEVTLHKIDLIPHAPAEERRQPRRRETIAHLPTSSQESTPHSSSTPDANFVAEEIMYDSSDIEMEDDSHVYSSPNKAKNLGFEIHQDQENQEEYTEPIDMSITRVLDDDDECTMDLTKPLGEIQLPQNNSTLQVQGSQEAEQLGSSQRPFGSIKSLFNDDEEEEEEGEVEMDLTQPFLKPQTEQPAPEITMQTSDMSMKMSQESSMELTSVCDGITDTITKKNTLLNKQLVYDIQADDSQATSEDGTMEQTQVFGKINSAVTVDESMDVSNAFTEIAMDETKIYTSTQNDDLPHGGSTTPAKSKTATPSKMATPLKPTRSHTSEAGSPMSSKRKSMSATSNDLRERINSLTPRKRRRTSHVDTRGSMHESVPPITYQTSQKSSQEEVRSSFTPLRTSNNHNRGSLLNSARIDIGSFTEKAPLAPSHEEGELQEDIYEPRSLRKFLDDLSIEFFDDLNINDDFTVEIKQPSDESNIHDVDYTIAKSSKLPWLELYSFSCNELQKNMSELKLLFDNLDDEFADENPQLVREYYGTQSLAQQKKLSDMLLMMKTHSDKESEKAWYSWHKKLLDELLARLQANLDVLRKDQTLLGNVNEELLADEQSLNQQLNNVNSQLQNFTAQLDSLFSEESKEMNALRLQLMTELYSLIEEEEQLDILEAEVQEINTEKFDTSAIEMEIEEKSVYVERNSQEPSLRLSKLLEDFQQLQSISGLTFESFESPNLHLSLNNSGIKAALDLSNPSEKQLALSETLPELTKVVINRYLAENSHHDINQVLKNVSHMIQNLNKFNKDIFYIGLVCPSVVEINDGINVELVDFNKVQRYKAKLSFKITQAQLLSTLNLHEVNAKVIYGPPNLESSTLLENLKQKLSGDHILRSVERLTLV